MQRYDHMKNEADTNFAQKKIETLTNGDAAYDPEIYIYAQNVFPLASFVKNGVSFFVVSHSIAQ